MQERLREECKNRKNAWLRYVTVFLLCRHSPFWYPCKSTRRARGQCWNRPCRRSRSSPSSWQTTRGPTRSSACCTRSDLDASTWPTSAACTRPPWSRIEFLAAAAPCSRPDSRAQRKNRRRCWPSSSSYQRVRCISDGPPPRHGNRCTARTNPFNATSGPRPGGSRIF